ncbi:unnamed protein product [Effrenium voratum]|nr:unnamed protein product [Effrenium voratum]
MATAWMAAFALMVCCRAKHLRCSDAPSWHQIQCFLHQDGQVLAQSAHVVEAAAVAWVAPITTAAIATAALAIAAAGLWWLRRAEDYEMVGIRSLAKEDESQNAKDEKEKCKKRIILFQGCLFAVDIASDVRVGIDFCERGLMCFGALLLLIPATSGCLCFLYKRWSWELAPHDHKENGKETLFFYEGKNRNGQKRPGLRCMVLQMLQLEALETARLAYYDPRFRKEWRTERAFNGLVESFPSCLIQAYTLLCMAQLGELPNPLDTAWQVFSIVLSCYSMAVAMKLISFRILPKQKVSNVSGSSWQDVQLTLLQFCDVSARLFTLAAFGVCLRPAIDITKNRQFELPLLMLAELVLVACMTTYLLNKRWCHSVARTRDAVLSTAISYLTIPSLVLHEDSDDTVVDYLGMMALQRIESVWRAAELLLTLCLVWYHLHTQAHESHVCIVTFATWSAVALACVLTTRLYDRTSRYEGRPILPAVSADGFGAAHWACALGNMQLLTRLLREKDDAIRARDTKCRSPAHIAALYQKEEALRLLHQFDSECMSYKDNAGWAPAHCAAHVGHEAVLKLLHQLAPDSLNSKAEDGALPSHIAAACGHDKMLNLLFELVPESLSAENHKGTVPAHNAANNGHDAVLELLHRVAPGSLNAKNDKGAVPAHRAAHNGHEQVLRLLCQLAPESLTATNNSGSEPSHYAAHNGHCKVLRLLHQCNPEALEAEDNEGKVPAHWAAHNGHEDVLSLLKELAPDTLQSRDFAGWTPAHMAARNGHDAVLSLLHRAAPECLQVKNVYGWTPAHSAAARGHDAVLKLLKKLAPKTLTAEAIDGAVPAHMAAAQGRATVLRQLHHFAPETLRAKNNYGCVPAHYAAEQGQDGIVKLLNELSPESLTAEANDGWVPAHTAAYHGRDTVMELLHQLAPESLEARDKDGLSPAKCAEIPLEECGDPIQEMLQVSVALGTLSFDSKAFKRLSSRLSDAKSPSSPAATQSYARSARSSARVSILISNDIGEIPEI